MAHEAGSEEQDLERIGELIAALDSEESLLLGFDASPVASPAAESALLELRQRRSDLEEELAVVWARRCSRC